MKKIYTLGLLLSISLSFGQASEDFLYSGALNASGWQTHSGTSGQLVTSNGSLSYTGITTAMNKVAFVAGNSEDVNKSVGTPITATTYFSAIINIPNTTGLTTAGDYSLAAGAAAGTPVSVLVARLFIKTSATAGSFNIGLVNNSGTGTLTSYVATDYPVGTPVFVVVKYDRTTGIASLFVNPTIGTAEPTATLINNSSTGAAPAQIASIVLRQAGTATSGTGNVEFDAIRIADNWTYVTGAVLSILENEISGLKVYPNPISGNVLNIETTLNGTKAITIFDVLGKQVLNTTIENTTVNIGTLNAGVYVVKVTEEGKTATTKLVVR